MSERHRGSRAPGLGTPHYDRRPSEHDETLQAIDPLNRAAWGTTEDPQKTVANLLFGADSSAGPLKIGVVLHAIPFLNWYKVQLGGGDGFIGCCMLTQSALTPIGVRVTSPITPGSIVIVHTPPRLDFGLILGVMPPIIKSGNIGCPDWIQQGGNSGLKREDAHSWPLTGMYRAGGVLDHSAGRPLDSTSMEWGMMAETGVGVHVDPFQAFLRVNEMCGLYLNYFDSHAGLRGVQLDIMSAMHELAIRDDEGECHLIEGRAVYPWEALGRYDPSGGWTKTNDDKVVQYEDPVGKIDLKDGEEGMQPVYRLQQFGGYLGQGSMRLLIKPAKEAGKRLAKDQDIDEGLFCESIGLDGDYMLRSAKGLSFIKRCKIIVPKQLKRPEDGGGDDLAADNYKFSGKFGGGDGAEDHKVGDVKVTGDLQHMRRVAGVADLTSYAANWKALHPFHYHQKDFLTKQESDTKNFDTTQETLTFSALAQQPYMADPTAKMLTIDHRYNEVAYYQTESYIKMLEDGSIVIGCGYGAQIVLSGGKLRLEAPGGIDICAGTDLLMLAAQIILKAKGSIDLSSSEKDIRLKAEQNLQMLGGNGGLGGILIESKGDSEEQKYKDQIGEDVRASGIVMKAAQAPIAALAKDIYLRTGGDALGSGNIVLDADKGKAIVEVYGRKVQVFAAEAVSFWLGPADEQSKIKHTYLFSEEACLVEAPLIVGGAVVVCNGGSLVVEGGISSSGPIQTTDRMADSSGGFLGQVPSVLASELASDVEEAEQEFETDKNDGEEAHKIEIVEALYQDEQLGQEDLIKSIGFSFRDKDGVQYVTEQLKWPELRWQQMARLGAGNGGTGWQETAVVYQGRRLMPWPGKSKWEDDEIFLELEKLTMYDAAKGQSKDRPEPYEEPELSDWKTATMADGYKLMR